MQTGYVRVLVFAPAIVALLVVGGLVGRSIYRGDQIAEQYRLAARQAIADKDLDEAKFYYSRLVGAGDQGSEQDQLNWVSILSESGDVQAARELLDRLAPDEGIGFAAAHRQKAALLQGRKINSENRAAVLEKLQWHLRHGANDGSVESDLMWANYYLAVDQVDNALDRLQSAAARRPEIWFDIHALCNRMGLSDQAKRASARAEAHARTSLEQDPTDVAQRVRLLALLGNDKKYDQVREILADGLRLDGSNPALRSVASNVILMRLAEVNDADESADQTRMALLSEAAKLSPANPNLYRLLTDFYAKSKSDESRAAFRRQLEGWIAGGQSVPLAHFSLGNLLWQESDTDGAVFHLEAALEADPTFVIVANNLAWILCQAEEPDFDRAEQLISMAIKQDPNNPSFCDTMATVLYNQQKYAESLPYFEKVLPKSQGEKKVRLHDQLAVVYESLGQDSMAQLHRKKASESARVPIARP